MGYFHPENFNNSDNATLPDPPRVLVVDDDAVFLKLTALAVSNAGMLVTSASFKEAIVRATTNFKPNIVIINLSTREVCDFGLIKLFADKSDCGLIVLSAENETSDRIISLELGADDCIDMPVTSREMVARIHAVHRRVQRSEAARESPLQSRNEFSFGSVRVNVTARTVLAQDGTHITVTAAEFGLLAMLIDAMGEPVSRSDLSKTVLRRPWQAEDRSLDQLVFRLRRKLPADQAGASLIHSVRGLGYLMRMAEGIQ